MPSRLASLVANAVSYFCWTSSQYPAPRHIQAPSWLHQDDIESLQQHLYPAVERRWLESIDQNHQAGIGHDIYLKLWALSNPIFQQIMFCLMKHKMLTHSCWVFYTSKKHTSDLCR